MATLDISGADESTIGPLLVIVGPTASGKTALAVQLAKQFNGEIICADSRTLYKGMDIGTAKPSAAEQGGITHHLLDVLDPDQSFTVADFKQLAEAAIKDVSSKGKLPILVGGSGLYVDSVIYNYQFSTDSRPRDAVNPRHLAKDTPRHDLKLRDNTLIIGLEVDPDVLRDRIKKRVADMLANGLVDEVSRLGQHYGWDISSMQAPAYKAFRAYVEGGQTLEEATERMTILDSQLAKKQRTWFKRNNSIQWLSDPSKSVEILTTFLNTR